MTRASWQTGCDTRRRRPGEVDARSHRPRPAPPVRHLVAEGVWETSAPWDGLSVGLTEDPPAHGVRAVDLPQGASLTAGSEAALADGRNTFAQIVTGAGGAIPA
ncbi:hypothetical protein [Brachybacterium sacelli]|uniref:hypothetical protein n=1 Tax=Brachybacterium sacelli TaxID=173364 RepID=UPI00360B098A